jgi:hypothetical protein
MEAYKTTYIVEKKGQITLKNIPFSAGTPLEIIMLENPEVLKKNELEEWRKFYLQDILSVSVWDEDSINQINKAGKEFDLWTLPQL